MIISVFVPIYDTDYMTDFVVNVPALWLTVNRLRRIRFENTRRSK